MTKRHIEVMAELLSVGDLSINLDERNTRGYTYKHHFEDIIPSARCYIGQEEFEQAIPIANMIRKQKGLSPIKKVKSGTNDFRYNLAHYYDNFLLRLRHGLERYSDCAINFRPYQLEMVKILLDDHTEEHPITNSDTIVEWLWIIKLRFPDYLDQVDELLAVCKKLGFRSIFQTRDIFEDDEDEIDDWKKEYTFRRLKGYGTY